MRVILCLFVVSFSRVAIADVTPTGPNRADESKARQLSLKKAADFLDAVSITWTHEQKCGTCHTNYAYMMARSSLSDVSPVPSDVRRFFENRAANWDTEKPRWDTEVVATAVTLAFDDARTTGQLNQITRKALDRMWTLQREDGSWDWLKCDWPPAESDDYYGVVFSAIGVGSAPDDYSETEAARKGLEKIRDYLKKNEPPNLHHRLMLLWASTAVDDLLSSGERKSIMDMILKLQRPDDGWSIRTLWGERKRHDGSSEDLSNPDSDAYATGLVVYVLRQAGMSSGHAALQRGIQWLRDNQRESGRWFVRSLSTDNHHYLSHFGTAYAVMALKACE